MTKSSQSKSSQSSSRRAVLLAALLAIQTLCAVFFVADVASDLRWGGLTAHTALEGAVAFALILGIAFAAFEMRRTLERNRRAEAALSSASGAFAELIDAYFEDWGLTPAEADVALFALKGLDVAEIAAFRGAASGTVRAQLARVYAKAKVSNRPQFISLFIEELLCASIVKPSASAN
ncbi:LuxR C-terminal-related transcriptional regulator [Aurantimonas sp. C2-6-R+9]|uniref:helix-turn-helix transcriptional regulator n=1 Tax=unclassified Aurantimonas TaxID=2638230 RepID=UPI002E17349E|nr:MULTISPECIES: LuxR C-terminal-related transcriptional regulator [unclassified Aurantimonas]MEC5289051.1 LuxR C-terminal-related transcriptional regulator [Aurantimonas sp. C2-3-R2]MEC5321942.1 LuxR C-terminal-related transcriptional regulator [Aurantimonas sp. A3-2-R12]MEC5379374.1 LuxR C-terminal-related transcriptional regulator [Aurantimonas sp. C2-6-R+9]MEC5410127.1 LuxR C-terminal-related transcriptional regulator [Aurantimonas sp. C2-4-R8]